jgi:hypothetical protein
VDGSVETVTVSEGEKGWTLFITEGDLPGGEIWGLGDFEGEDDPYPTLEDAVEDALNDGYGATWY